MLPGLVEEIATDTECSRPQAYASHFLLFKSMPMLLLMTVIVPQNATSLLWAGQPHVRGESSTLSSWQLPPFQEHHIDIAYHCHRNDGRRE